LRVAVVAGRVNRLRRSRKHLYTVSLNQQVDDESAAGLNADSSSSGSNE
jgi:hypothetical protein